MANPHKNYLGFLGYTIDDLHKALQGKTLADYARVRDYMYERLVNSEAGMPPTYFQVYWHRLVNKLTKQYGYVLPRSEDKTAVRARQHRHATKDKVKRMTEQHITK